MKSMLIEGGNAVKGASPINQENVAATLTHLYKTILPAIGITKNDLKLLGSTGKKRPGESSGDIDMAVDAGRIIYALNVKDAKDLWAAVGKALKGKVKQLVTNPGTGVISFTFPISNTNGKQKGQVVQTDLMVVDDIHLAGFTFWSPSSEESKYKGVQRNIMLSAVATHMDYKILKKGYDEQGKEIPVTFERNFIDMKRGLKRGLQTRIGKTGKLFASGRKQTVASKVVSDQPDEIVKMMFGPKFGPSDVTSLESILRVLDDPACIQHKNKKEIMKSAAETFKLIRGMVLPSELKKYA